ncbi:alpha-mannosidase [Microbacterium immunditiarum]|uniref:Alpha-mannosidase n=1 Tax=Microbacterium immunditiarum TaxID=337480 RepID=A0A7Y9KHT7_9MICO|nr:glycoside hydrolase family 38 C-terminal domain-containing protein [Microbacterium immunditiarum]NYE18040.1 alpha-mannosidase [Microbacterium immunditiarum]
MHITDSLTIERAQRVLRERIAPAVYSQTAPLTVEEQRLSGEPIPFDKALEGTFQPHAPGSAWGAAWGTTWFRITGAVPAEWSGRTVEAVIDLGFDTRMAGFQCEGLVHRPDGTAVKALNPDNQWVRIADAARGGESVELYIEAAANPVILDRDHRFAPTDEGDVHTSSPALIYTTRRIELAVFEREVWDLLLDLEVLLELVVELPVEPRRAKILQALDDSLDALHLQDIPGTAAAARAALGPVLAMPASASAHDILAVGHSHIDSAWLWPLRETRRKVARTTSSMLSLLETDEDFVYSMSSAQQFDWIRKERPELWGRITRAVADGRFIPVGGMWVESDTVMPSGESLARQFLYGQRFFDREFGERSRGVWLPDSFGYSPALPQLIRRAGFDWFFTQKISWNQTNRFPHHTFEWEGIDGSRVLTHFSPMDTYASTLAGDELAKASRQFAESRVANESIAPVGYGDGGGGTTREMLGRAARLSDLEGSPRVRWASPDELYARAAEVGTLPVWVGELYLEMHRATLTTHHQMKWGNRRAEERLLEAELWAATAALRVGADYPYDELDELWETVLLHQFHDILPGTSIAWVHREARERYAEVLGRADAIIDEALGRLVGEGDQRIQVNPTPFAIHATPPGGGAADSATTDAAATTLVRRDSSFVLDNGVIRVVIDQSGHIASAVDLRAGRDIIPAGTVANRLRLYQDFPNKWDAWDIDEFYRNAEHEIGEVEHIEADVTNATAGVFVRRRISDSSTVEQRLSLAPGERVLQIEQTVEWHETEKLLKIAFPLDIHADSSVAETQFGYVRRPTHTNTSWDAARFETSMHRYVLIEEPGFGAAVVNDSSYGFDVTREPGEHGSVSCLRISLLRAPRYPDPLTDQGTHTHRLGLVVGADIAAATRHGYLINAHDRVRTGERGFDPLVEIVGDGLVVSSVKLAADRSGALIVRVYESLGRRSRGHLRARFAVASAHEASLIEDVGAPVEQDESGVILDLAPFEVRTLRLSPIAEM